MLTFLAYAEHRKLEFASYRSGAEGILDRVDGKYRVTRIVIRPVLALKRRDDIGMAEEVLKDAETGCFITNSVNATVHLEPRFIVEEIP
jgi:organic hydroperoxide reductase OsmC/OhrA